MNEYEKMFRNNPADMFLGETNEEKLATLSGIVAMIKLSQDESDGRERLRCFHQLRAAARHCPNAAYNLGNYFADETEKPRRKRSRLKMELYAQAAEMGLARLRNPEEPFAKAPKREGPLRDIVSRALTNIGGTVSNAGKPTDAVKYFRQAIDIHPGNPNSHVCLGNMGIWYGDTTGVSPIEGIREWKTAGKIGDYCAESANGCPCRANVVAVTERIVKNYGEAAANEWLATRYRKSCARRSNRDVVDALASAADADLIGVDIPPRAATASKAIYDSGIVARLREEPLEVRVTVMASAVGTFLNKSRRPAGEKVATLHRAREACDRFEPLKAILAEEDWKWVGPPETDYLGRNDVRRALSKMVDALVLPVARTTSSADPLEGTIAMLSHLDRSFRGGVGAMVEYWLPLVQPGIPIYIPATFVGERADQ
jgi:hypothetical protein